MFSHTFLKRNLVGGTSLGLFWYFKDEIKNTAIGSIRFGRAAVAVANIIQDYKKTNRLIAKVQQNSVKLELKSQVHSRSAKKLLDLCCINGGAFIKVGQHVGTLEYLLPIEYVTTLKVLHDDAPKSSTDELLKIFKIELKRDPYDIFCEFDPEPLGTASLAQVHKARLNDGQLVAVKIQHPLVLDHSKIDIKGMEILVKCVGKIFPDFQFQWLAEETKKNLPVELDFSCEAENAEKVAKMFSHFSWLKIPSVHWDLSTKRVLTMEYCEGGRVNDLMYFQKNNIDPYDVSRKMGTLYSEMIFVNGYVHCDPHPGNVLVKKVGSRTQVVLLDHGLYCTLTEEFRITYGKLWRSILSANVPDIYKYAKILGVGNYSGIFACMVTGRSWESIGKGIDKQRLSPEETCENKETAANLVPEIAKVLNMIPSNMLLILKTNDLLRGIEYSLKTHVRMNSFVSMSRCCIKAIYDQERKYCNSMWCIMTTNIAEKFENLKISVYGFYLFIISLSAFS